MASRLEEWRTTMNRARVVPAIDRRASVGVVAMVVAALAAMLVLGATVGSRDADAAFPGTNGKIIFQSGRITGGGPGLYTITPGGTADKLPGTDNGDIAAVWSPDGSRVAFQHAFGSDQEISVMNADGTGQKVITDPTLNMTEQEPTWSPDGSRIVFVADPPGPFDPPDPDQDETTDREIWMINADGSGLTQLTDNEGGDDTEPAWSPDGEQIAFVSHHGRPGQKNTDIYVMDANPATSDALAVSLTADFTPPGCIPRCYQPNDVSPSWSPDGSQITYSTVFDVWKMDTDPATTDWTNLTDGSGGGFNPAWSPDGSSIAYSRFDVINGRNEMNIYVMDASNGGNKTAVDTTLRSDRMSDWQPVPEPPRCDLDDADGDNTVIGTDADETICGLEGNDFINGGGGDDVLIGGPGNDTLVDPSGRATLNGGADNDTVSFENAGKVSASLTSGFAQRVGTSPLEGVALVDVENLMGSPLADTLTGSNAANKLLGLGGKDRINSRDGLRNDTVNGGPGTDKCATDRREASIKSC
jgi:Ca2+-binding RTX toxin-like protein